MRGAAALLALASTACSFAPGTAPGATATDAASADIGPPDRDAPSDAWSAPVEITELNSGAGDDDPSLTADQLEIFWGSRRAGGLGAEDIWTAKRASKTAPWGTPTTITQLNSSAAETTIRVRADGLALYFTSDRSGNDPDIYVSTRSSRSAAWTTPVRIAEVSTNGGDYAPYVHPDGLRMIWCAGTSLADEALWTSERPSSGDPWETPVRIAELDEANTSECDPLEVSRLVVYYSSNRSGAGYDIYRASRSAATDPYGSRAAIAPVNVTTFNDRDAWVSADERTMVFASDRTGGIDRLFISTR